MRRQSLINKLRKSRFKLAIKKMTKLIEKKDAQAIKKFYPKFQSELMKIAIIAFFVRRLIFVEHIPLYTERILE